MDKYDEAMVGLMSVEDRYIILNKAIEWLLTSFVAEHTRFITSKTTITSLHKHIILARTYKTECVWPKLIDIFAKAVTATKRTAFDVKEKNELIAALNFVDDAIRTEFLAAVVVS